MITSINEFKESLENNIFNINDIKKELPEYNEILNLGFIDNTSNIQYKRGALNFISNSSDITKIKIIGNTYNKNKGKNNQLEYTIYANGILRMNAPGYYTKMQHITFNLNKPIENIDDCKILLNKLINSIKRKNFNNE